MYSLSTSVVWLGTGIILISFIIALLIAKCNIPYMKGFFFCPLIALLVSINTICGSLFVMYPINLFFLIQNFMSFLDLLFWCIFFLLILKDKKDADKIKILLAITLLFAVYLHFFSNVNNQNLHIIALTAICKTIYCIFFFYKLFKNLFYQNLLKEPSFWIATGLIFYSCLSLPFYGLNSYFKFQFSPLISSNIFSISNMLLIIMHLFFIKAYICTIRVHKA